jgi:hypothetical protein
MKILRVILTVVTVVAVLWAGAFLLLIRGMSGKEEVVRKLASPSGNVVAIQTNRSGFAGDSADVYLKRGRFGRKERLDGCFFYIINLQWQTSPEELQITYSHVFEFNDYRVYLDRFRTDGTKISSEVVGRYVISPDGASYSIIPADEDDNSRQTPFPQK